MLASYEIYMVCLLVATLFIHNFISCFDDTVMLYHILIILVA